MHANLNLMHPKKVTQKMRHPLNYAQVQMRQDYFTCMGHNPNVI